MGGGKADLPGRSPSFARAKAGALAVACPERPREAGESKGAIPAFGRWRWSFGIRRKNKRDKNTKKDCFREEVPEKPKKMFPEEWFCRKSSSAYNAGNGDLAEFADPAHGVFVLRESAAGPYACRNTGIRHARGVVIALTDSDCRLAPNWLAAGVRQVLSLQGGVVAGRIVVTTSAKPTAVELYEQATVFRQEDIVSKRQYALTGNMFVPRAFFDRVGLFNASLLSGGDYEWGDRASRRGVSFSFGPDAVVYHRAKASFVPFFRRMSRVVDGLVSVEKRRQGTFFALLLSLLKDYSYNFSNLRVILMSGRLEGISQRVRALWVWCILQGVCVLQVLRSCSTEERCR